MAKPQVRVRMYRRLLGDCFLITIGDPKGPRNKRSHILIDCGVLQHVPGEAKLMKEVAADIRKAVDDYIDLLVITHEHWDHISGFAHARSELIDTFNIKELWLAWTERRGDQQADDLRAKSQPAKVVVATASAAAGGSNATGSLEDFNGPVKKGKLSSTEIIPELIDRATKAGSIQYLEPGKVLDTPGPLGLRANVLAPPRDPDKLMKDLPTPDAKETYIYKPRDFAASVATRYALADTIGTAIENAGVGPFGWSYRRSLNEVRSGTNSIKRWLRGRYLSAREQWRNVDDDWLDAAGALALKLDSDTNNTSLVLAFELEPGGDVLLFAADAQVGNWLSWHSQKYADPKRPDAQPAEASDLLRRTIFYKVGHHASHNATLKDLGLELMTHPKMSAMIPVVEAEARRKNAKGDPIHRGWNMPFPDLYERLLAKTQGRLLRGDCDAGKGPDGKAICKDQQFLSRVSGDTLFHELRIQ